MKSRLIFAFLGLLLATVPACAQMNISGGGTFSATYNTPPNWSIPNAPISLANGSGSGLQLDAFGRLITVGAYDQQMLSALQATPPGKAGRLFGTFNRPVTSTADALDVNVKYPPAPITPTSSISAAPSPFRNAAVTSAVTVKTAGGNLYAWMIYNPNASACFLDFFNTTSPTLGTTVPVWTVAAPATAAANVAPGALPFVNFSAGISVASVTASGGASTCGTGMTVSLSFY